MTRPLRTLLAMVRDNAAAGDEELLCFVGIASDGSLLEERRSYATLLGRGERLAGALRDRGLGPGDRFALLMRNRAAFVEAMIASEILGSEFVSIDPRIRGDKLAEMLRFAECQGVIVCADGWANLEPELAGLPQIRWVWNADPCGGPRAISLDAVIEESPNLSGQPAPLDRTMQLMFTSSTTGPAKAICVTHGRFAGAASMAETFRLKPTDRLYNGLSLTHANAQFVTLASGMALNIPVVISRQFTKSRFWQLLSHYRCTVFNLLGGMASAIYSEPPSPLESRHEVRMVISAGMPAALWRAFENRYGVEVLEFFGSAEGGLLVNPPGDGPVGSIGRPAPGLVCAILDPDDRVCGPMKHGEICFRQIDGSIAPVRYHKNHEASVEKTRGGWFRTGDVGYLDEAGWAYFSHRAGRSVRRNGDFVDTAAIEALIAAMPEANDVYVYGVRTETTSPGEREVVAAVVALDGPGAAPAIMTHCLANLGTIGAPDFIQILQAIPKTASEKPVERHLVEMINRGDRFIHNRNGRTLVSAFEGRDDYA